jgi:glutamate synthase (NADPH/NADH) small chain
MPCFDYEYELAKRDGCGFRFHATPIAILGGSRVEGLRVKIHAGEEVIACDMVIKALGQATRAEIAIPENPKVFIGGDFANGGAEIVNAAAEGKQAALKIHELLGGRRG